MRPRGVGEILDGSLKLYLRNARTLMGLAAMVVVPVQVIEGIILLSTVSSTNQVPTGFSNFSSTSSTGRPSAVAVGAYITVAVIGLIATTLTTAACVKAVSDTYLDQPTAIGQSLRYAFRRLPALLGMEILLFLGLVLAFICLIIPGIWLYGAWSVATPALLIEAKGPAGALGRSRRLVKGRWWATAGVVLTATIMASVISGVFQGLLVVVGLLAARHSVVATVAVSSFAGAVAAVLTQPFQAAVHTILYYDLRIRKEGFDLELIAQQLGLPASALPSSVGASTTYGADLPFGPESVGKPGGPPFWPPPPGWSPEA